MLLLGKFKQSHNAKIIELYPKHAIFEGKAYDLVWLGEHAFYFKYGAEWWFYIKNGNKYEVVKQSAYHQLDPVDPKDSEEKLIGLFRQSHNLKTIEIRGDSALFEGSVYPMIWIETHTFWYKAGNDYWYYIKNDKGGYEVVKYIPQIAYHVLEPISVNFHKTA